MELSNIIGYAIAAGILLLVLFIVGFLLSRMYKKSTKDSALVKTGLGGERVITTGGVMLIPGFQELPCVFVLKKEKAKHSSQKIVCVSMSALIFMYV
jgi:uncharacterized membrane protein YqiK